MLRLSMLFIVVLAIAGCGGSDPVQDSNYRALRDNSKPFENHSHTPLNQSAAPNDFLSVTILNQDKGSGNFIEEKSGEVQFQITPYPGIASYEVSSTNNPSGSVIRRSPSNPNIFLFDWTPAKGTVPEDQSVKLLQIRIVIAPHTGDPRYINLTSNADIPISVVKVRSRPVVERIEDPKNGKVDEGGTFSFSVIVADPTETESPPDIAISPFDPENKEDPKSFGFIQPAAQDAVKIGSGEWRRFYNFSLAGIDLSHSNLTKIKDASGQLKTVNTIQVCANFWAISVSRMASDSALPKCWTVSLTAQSPEFIFMGAPITESILHLTAGPDLKIEFDANIPNKRGTAVVKNTSLNFDKWAGHPNPMSCVNGDGNDASMQKCTVTWADPCKAKGTFMFKVSGSNSAAMEKAPSRDSRQIVISPPTTGCDQPGAPATAAVAPAPVRAPTDRVVRGTAGAVTGDAKESVPAVSPAGDTTKSASYKKKAHAPFNKAQRDRDAKLKADAAAAAAANSATVPDTTSSTGGSQ